MKGIPEKAAKRSRALELSARECDLGRVHVASLEVVDALERLVGGQRPSDGAVVHERGGRAVIRDEVGVMLDDDDRLAVVLVEVAQHLVGLPRMVWVELRHRLVEHDDIGAQRDGPSERQQVLLTAGQLPDVGARAVGEPAQLQSAHAALQVVVARVVEAGERRLVDDRGTDQLVLEILVHVSDAPGKSADIGRRGVHAAHLDGPGQVPDDEVRNQSVHRLA